jgi:hypothetical protein|tara:strand:+ start:286 stop:837 length:552 start_codon:yes stop_codon:yes gene_type:complete
MEKNMRHYKLAPTWKKSVVEYSTFMKDGILAKYELGWRWGDFLINIPETDEEFLEWVNKFSGFDTIEEAKENYSDIFENDSITDKYMAICGPDLESEFHELDDYDYEMLGMDDGCWSDWTISGFGSHDLTEEVKTELAEQLQEIYDEEYEEGLEQEGWTHKDYWTEIHGPVTLHECDEEGQEQ